MPRPVPGRDREAVVDTHQLRADHWSRSRQYLHPPLAGVRRVSRQGVPGGTLPRVPERGRCAGRHAAPMPVPGRSAPRLLGSINVSTKQLQDDGVVAALAQASGATRNR